MSGTRAPVAGSPTGISTNGTSVFGRPKISCKNFIGEGAARVSEGIKDFGIEYDVVRDADTQVAKTYRVLGTPTVVFLDKKGVIRYLGNELPKDYAARLDTLTNES